VTLVGGGDVGEDVGEAVVTQRKADSEVSGLAISPSMTQARRLGRKVSIVCNHFPFAITPRTIYQYNVEFTVGFPPTPVLCVVLHVLQPTWDVFGFSEFVLVSFSMS
jgi:hypothetical protein